MVWAQRAEDKFSSHSLLCRERPRVGGTRRAIVLALLNVTLALQMSTVLEAQWWLRNLYAVFGGVSWRLKQNCLESSYYGSDRRSGAVNKGVAECCSFRATVRGYKALAQNRICPPKGLFEG